MNPPPWADLIAVRLPLGRDRAVTIGTLQEQLGVSRRVIEKAVEELRASGRPVCTGSEGVWLTDSAAELREQYARLRSRYVRQAVNARVLLATARRYEKHSQLGMFDAA